MKPSSDLHELISALTPTEKRYFRVQSLRVGDGDNNYLRLFDAIAAQPQYDEEAIKARFQGETFLKHLPSEKNYLYNAILKAMRGYHEGNQADARIMVLLQELRFLHERGLLAQCQKALTKALRLAEEFQRPALSLLLLDWQSRLDKVRSTKALGEALEETARHRHEATAQVQRATTLAIAYDRFFAQATTALNPAQAPQPSEHLPPPLPGDRFEDQLRLHTAQAMHAQLRADFEQVFRHFSDAASLWEQHPAFIDDNPGDYIRTLSNVLVGLHNLGRYDAFPPILAKIRGLRQGPFAVEFGQFAYADYYELLMHLATRRYQDGLALVPSIMAGLKHFAAQLPHSRAIAFRYNLGLLHFFAAKHKAALDHFRHIIDLPESGIRTDILIAARLLFLLVHLDLGNFDFLEGQVRNLRRSLDRKHASFSFEEAVLAYLEEAIQDPQPAHQAAAARALSAKLAQLQPGTRTGLDEVQAWLALRR